MWYAPGVLTLHRALALVLLCAGLALAPAAVAQDEPAPAPGPRTEEEAKDKAKEPPPPKANEPPTKANEPPTKANEPPTTEGDAAPAAKADGKFELWNTGPGRYLVRAIVRSKSAGQAEIDTARLGDKPFEIVLEPIVPVAIDATAMAKNRCPLITIRDANNLPVYTRYLRTPAVYTAELPAGRYTYELHDDLKLADSGAVIVKASGKPRIVVR